MKGIAGSRMDGFSVAGKGWSKPFGELSGGYRCFEWGLRLWEMVCFSGMSCEIQQRTYQAWVKQDEDARERVEKSV